MPTLVELAELEEAAKHEACRPHRRVVQSEEMNDADRLFVKIDTNESGTIDADELLIHLLEVGVDTDEISRTFAAIDTDGSGEISKDELRNHLKEFSSYSFKAIGKIFKMLDGDGDNSITQSEMRDAFVKYSALRQAIGEGPNFK